MNEEGTRKAKVASSDSARSASQLFFNLPFLSPNGADGESTCVRPMRFARSAVAVRKHLSLLSYIGEMVGRHGAAL